MSEFTDRQAAVERFLYQEARLLDDRQFAQWVDLFTEDAVARQVMVLLHLFFRCQFFLEQSGEKSA